MSRELNLVPRQRAEVKTGVSSKKTIGVMILLIIVFVGGSVAYVFGSTMYYEKKLQTMKDELSKNNAKVEEKNKLIEQIEATKNQIAKAKQLSESRKNNTDELLKTMRECIVIDGSTIDTMDYYYDKADKKKNQVTITGVAKSKEALQKSWANLRETKGFEKSQLNSWKDTDKGYEFKITISFEEDSKDETK